ncbi:SDR family NAD(P)-dependent oxidoreductase [Dickeya fangzhongdai]|uniref:SDR family NAD(P)-dependent oxidoreductase n=2 Tax=Dickeya fangzhongdai TaxID=1778540 RepID=UPI0004F8A0E3|nr:SDR family NAD(P)-dependent oxidoreductase [Dickeya fangzhongdai]AIR67716.1 oxidoreductase [Dickeya fangzhongdai]KGT96732.1 oxidoreductase [Dickeya fangzhongdai]
MNYHQRPFKSGFSASSTIADVMQGVSLHGKTAMVTGGHSGLGLATVQALYAAGAHVIVPARDVEKARKALQASPGVDVAQMDLTSPASIRIFAQEFIDRGIPLHILVNNAGIMATPELEKDIRDVEIQFATNHLGHFQLTALLWPALIQAHGARVITVSSRAHRVSPVVFEDINFAQRPYDCWQAYGQSKTANILFTRELAKRGEPWLVQAFSVHPGAIYSTSLARNMNRAELQASGALDADGKATVDLSQDRKSTEQGAATQVWCATSHSLDGYSGQYCEDCQIAPLLSPDTPPMVLGEMSSMTLSGVDAFTMNDKDSQKLWEISEAATGLKFL